MSAKPSTNRLKTLDGRACLEPREISVSDRIRRAVWNTTWALLGRWSPVPLFGWRRSLARAFGATIGTGAHIYPRTRIWAPWNLAMGERSCLADGTTCYNVARVTIGDDVVVSQDAYICTATHGYNDRSFPLLAGPIVIEAHTWVAAGAFVSPGLTLHRGAVIGARSVVTESVPTWTVVAGNPARYVKSRRNFDLD